MTDPIIEGEDILEEENRSIVELDADTYDGLLERLAELEERSTPAPQKPRSTVDELADEGTQYEQDTQVVLPADLDDLNNTQLVTYLVDTINSQAGKRLEHVEVALETMRVAREIDKVENKYTDFWTYGNKIKEIALANPALTIERAYHLAKAEMPKQPKTGEESNKRGQTRTERLLKLPARTYGEKPTMAASSTSEMNKGTSLKSAAERAWEETVGKDKKSI